MFVSLLSFISRLLRSHLVMVVNSIYDHISKYKYFCLVVIKHFHRNGSDPVR